MFRADLHCHTTCSDGTMTPRELVIHAKEIGLSALSITDHDTIAAYESAIPAAKENGLILGTGVEFSTSFRKTSIHVLAYDFDLQSEQIRGLCSRHVKRRKTRNQMILERLSRLSMPVFEEELNQFGSEMIGRPHIAQVMVRKGYVSSIKEAFHRFLGDGCPCFESGQTISLEETLTIIHEGGGKAFIAHPHLIVHRNTIKELLKLPFDGIECYYAKIPPFRESVWLKIAKEQGLLVSGGSDFHGAVKEHIPLGSSWVGEEAFHQIFQRPCATLI